MRQITLLTISCMAIVLYVSGQRSSTQGQAKPMGYELYSWRGSKGGWSFCVVPSPSGANVPAEEVFNKKFLLAGVKELKRKISRLPVGATIYWPDRISGTDQKANQSETLSYPPTQTIQDIQRYADTRKIKVEMLSGQGEHQ